MARSYDFQRKEDEEEKDSSKSARGKRNVTIPADLAAQGLIDFRPFGGQVAQPGLVATTIAYQSGNNQSAVAGEAITNPFEVLVTDDNGTPVPEVEVTWSASGDAAFDSDSSFTDINGVASNTLAIGSLVGTYTITASASGLSGSPITFTGITATVGPADSMSAIGFQTQTGTISTPVTHIPTIVVVDARNNPVSGVHVTWAVASGGGSIDDSADDTDANGISDCDGWTLGATPGTNSVTATVAGLANSPILFTCDASGTNAPTQIALTAGSGQSPVAGAAISTPFQFTVKDAGDAAVEGVTVSFTTNGGTLSVASAVTDASGQVSVTLTTPTDVRTTTVTASFTAASGTISTTATATSVAGTATKLRVVTQPSSQVVAGTVFSQQPIIEITDANNNRKLSATNNITISKFSGPSGSLQGTQTVAAVAGLCTYTNILLAANASAGNFVFAFAASGLTGVNSNTVVCVPPPDPAFALSEVQQVADTQEDTVITPSPSAAIVDVNGVPISSDTSAVTVALGNAQGATLSGTLTRNAVTGVAAFPGLSVNNPGSAYTLIYSRSGLSNLTSAPFDISAAPSQAHPFEPAGAVQKTELIIMHRPDVEDAWNLVSGGSHVTEVAKTGAERATTNALHLSYATAESGKAPITVSKNFVGGDVTELYMDMDYCWESSYIAHNSGVNKTMFINSPTTAGGCPFVLEYSASQPAASGKVRIAIQGAVRGLGGNDASGVHPNLIGQTTIQRDVVARIIIYCKLNSVVGGVPQEDGIIRCWVGLNGGALVEQTFSTSNTNLCFRGPAGSGTGTSPSGGMTSSQKIHRIKWSPTWGGTATPTTPTPGGFQRMGYFYASGVA